MSSKQRRYNAAASFLRWWPSFLLRHHWSRKSGKFFLARTLTRGQHRSVLLETCACSLMCQLELKCRLLILQIDGRHNCEYREDIFLSYTQEWLKIHILADQTVKKTLIEVSPLLAIHPFHPRKRGTPALSSSMVSHHSVLGISYWHTLLLQRQRKTIQKLISSVREGRRLEGNVQCSCTLYMYNVHCSVSADIVYSVFPVCRSVYKQIASLRNLWASGLVRCWQWAFEFSLSCA